MDSPESLMKKRLIPKPVFLKCRNGEPYTIQENCIVKLFWTSAEAVETLEHLFFVFWRVKPEIEVYPGKTMETEYYELEIKTEELIIYCSDEKGLRNAFYTLRQMADVNRNSETLQNYLLDPCVVKDGPEMPFRGIHFCLFPETPLYELEKNIRLAAYHKFNYAIIEPWGVFPYDSHPDLCWPEMSIDKTELKRIIEVGRKLGITLVPQLNLLGHAAAARVLSGKHAILDHAPQYTPLFEPDGWSWCLSNQATREVLSDLVLELHEFFGSPSFFHIGCDEACGVATCRQCRLQDRLELIGGHINYFHDLLKKRGAQTILWHDMLLPASDPRWRVFVANNRDSRLDNLIDSIRKDIIIADWEYGIPPVGSEERTWPTADFFNEKGFQTLLCSWNREEDVISMGKSCSHKKLFGMLVTMWNDIRSASLPLFYYTGACAAWNPSDNMPLLLADRLSMNVHLRQVCQDMGIVHYEQLGVTSFQVDRHPSPM